MSPILLSIISLTNFLIYGICSFFLFGWVVLFTNVFGKSDQVDGTQTGQANLLRTNEGNISLDEQRLIDDKLSSMGQLISSDTLDERIQQNFTMPVTPQESNFSRESKESVTESTDVNQFSVATPITQLVNTELQDSENTPASAFSDTEFNESPDTLPDIFEGYIDGGIGVMDDNFGENVIVIGLNSSRQTLCGTDQQTDLDNYLNQFPLLDKTTQSDLLAKGQIVLDKIRAEQVVQHERCKIAIGSILYIDLTKFENIAVSDFITREELFNLNLLDLTGLAIDTNPLSKVVISDRLRNSSQQNDKVLAKEFDLLRIALTKEELIEAVPAIETVEPLMVIPEFIQTGTVEIEKAEIEKVETVMFVDNEDVPTAATDNSSFNETVDSTLVFFDSFNALGNGVMDDDYISDVIDLSSKNIRQTICKVNQQTDLETFMAEFSKMDSIWQDALLEKGQIVLEKIKAKQMEEHEKCKIDVNGVLYKLFTTFENIAVSDYIKQDELFNLNLLPLKNLFIDSDLVKDIIVREILDGNFDQDFTVLSDAQESETSFIEADSITNHVFEYFNPKISVDASLIVDSVEMLTITEDLTIESDETPIPADVDTDFNETSDTSVFTFGTSSDDSLDKVNDEYAEDVVFVSTNNPRQTICRVGQEIALENFIAESTQMDSDVQKMMVEKGFVVLEKIKRKQMDEHEKCKIDMNSILYKSFTAFENIAVSNDISQDELFMLNLLELTGLETDSPVVRGAVVRNFVQPTFSSKVFKNR